MDASRGQSSVEVVMLLPTGYWFESGQFNKNNTFQGVGCGPHMVPQCGKSPF